MRRIRVGSLGEGLGSRWAVALGAAVLVILAIEAYVFVTRPFPILSDPGWSVAGLVASPLVAVVTLVLAVSALRAYTSELRHEAHHLAETITAEVFGGFAPWPQLMSTLRALGEMLQPEAAEVCPPGTQIDATVEQALQAMFRDSDINVVLDASAGVRQALSTMLSSAVCMSYVEWRSQNMDRNPALTLRHALKLYAPYGVTQHEVLAEIDRRIGVMSSASMQLACWRFMVTGYDLKLQRRPREHAAHRVLLGMLWGGSHAEFTGAWLGDLTIPMRTGQLVINMVYLLYLVYELWPEPEVLDAFVLDQLPKATREYLPRTGIARLGSRDTMFGRSLSEDMDRFHQHPEMLLMFIAPGGRAVRAGRDLADYGEAPPAEPVPSNQT